MDRDSGFSVFIEGHRLFTRGITVADRRIEGSGNRYFAIYQNDFYRKDCFLIAGCDLLAYLQLP